MGDEARALHSAVCNPVVIPIFGFWCGLFLRATVRGFWSVSRERDFALRLYKAGEGFFRSLERVVRFQKVRECVRVFLSQLRGTHDIRRKEEEVTRCMGGR